MDERLISRKLQIYLLAEVKIFEHTSMVCNEIFAKDKSKYAVLYISPLI